jgi:8-oxo-dGTP diphosphatase
MIKGTLCYIIAEGKILLIRKKKGFGEGKYNGPGGKVEEGETLQTAAVREFVEETGVTPLNPEHKGTVAFYFGQSEKPDWLVHIFTATRFKGEPIQTEEAEPGWFSTEDIPYSNMWPDDKIWMPLMLQGKKFMGKFWFDGKGEIMHSHEIVEIGN